MKAKDLRIGNSVFYNGEIISISETGLREYAFIGDCYAKSKTDRRNYSPIPLTDRRLKNLGFERYIDPIWDEVNFRFIPDWFYIKKREGKYNVGLSHSVGAGTRSFFTIDIIYVHQLQNLYYALTCNELNFRA